MFSAMLLAAAAALSASAHAADALPDPTDAMASQPAIHEASAFTHYRPYRDEKAPSWRALNDAVGRPPATHAAAQPHTSGDAEPAR
ncbi:hypothetical protein AWB80_07350 [Caballeronia pedi]|uniref:Hydrolase n=2 Tax=Caballeronia pedi TaxID=1777141 RepID=A0A158DSF1_9BURK|nr:hypothetical protein AWB80_07350 [Caballeronia pedi]